MADRLTTTTAGGRMLMLVKTFLVHESLDQLEKHQTCGCRKGPKTRRLLEEGVEEHLKALCAAAFLDNSPEEGADAPPHITAASSGAPPLEIVSRWSEDRLARFMLLATAHTASGYTFDRLGIYAGEDWILHWLRDRAPIVHRVFLATKPENALAAAAHGAKQAAIAIIVSNQIGQVSEGGAPAADHAVAGAIAAYLSREGASGRAEFEFAFAAGGLVFAHADASSACRTMPRDPLPNYLYNSACRMYHQQQHNAPADHPAMVISPEVSKLKAELGLEGPGPAAFRAQLASNVPCVGAAPAEPFFSKLKRCSVLPKKRDAEEG